jgi:hypothetical protein
VLPIDRVNDAVLKALAGDVLRPTVVSAIIDGFLKELLPANVEGRVKETPAAASWARHEDSEPHRHN